MVPFSGCSAESETKQQQENNNRQQQVSHRSDVSALGRGILGRLPNHVTDEDDDADQEHNAAKGAEGDMPE
tara:strand:- start:123 stop:335 length:213 start_codon:yes stop_codon:yes gene_type:complete